VIRHTASKNLLWEKEERGEAREMLPVPSLSSEPTAAASHTKHNNNNNLSITTTATTTTSSE
jgi:hypothetical protein